MVMALSPYPDAMTGAKLPSSERCSSTAGKQAQDREAEEHDHFRKFRISRGCYQGGHGADVPEESQAGGGERQPASAQASTGAVPQEQVQKNAEDNCAGGVADGVNELGLVESGQTTVIVTSSALPPRGSSVVRLFGSVG